MKPRWLLAAVLVLAAPAVAQEATPAAPGVAQQTARSVSVPAHVQTAAEALEEDAAAYARVAGLTPDEAARQLRAQAETVPLTDALAAEFADRLAGVAVEHRPYRIVVTLTGDAPVADRTTTAGGMIVPISFRTGAPATRAALIAAITAHQAELRAMLPHPPGMGVDPRTGTLAVTVSARDADLYAPGELVQVLGDIARVPVTVRVIDRLDTNSAVDGGGRVDGVNPADGHRYACTSGFTVTDGARGGIVTAAHCPDDLAYVDIDNTRVPLTFLGQWGWSFQDVQLHLAAAPLEPLFYADTAKTLLRPVTATRPRASTRAGDVVCHRGERTGYSCAEVELTDFAPAGDLCGGPCAPTWVTVAGPTCRAGDSGGPVFDGTTALGIVKGASYRSDGRCLFYIYMSADYMPTGWRVLLAPTELAPVQSDPSP